MASLVFTLFFEGRLFILEHQWFHRSAKRLSAFFLCRIRRRFCWKRNLEIWIAYRSTDTFSSVMNRNIWRIHSLDNNNTGHWFLSRFCGWSSQSSDRNKLIMAGTRACSQKMNNLVEWPILCDISISPEWLAFNINLIALLIPVISTITPGTETTCTAASNYLHFCINLLPPKHARRIASLNFERDTDFYLLAIMFSHRRGFSKFSPIMSAFVYYGFRKIK